MKTASQANPTNRIFQSKSIPQEPDIPMTQPLRAVIYARFSTDMQRDASIDDQIRSCREHAVRQGL